MKALMMKEYLKFEYCDVPKPEPGPGEVLIRVKACAVCGSDVHGADGSTGRRIPPVIMGHEASGVVEACGTDVDDYQPGDRVTFDSTVYCGKCEMCQAGNVNLCKDRRVLGVSCDDYRMDGAFAEYIVVPSYILYRLPENVTFQAAAMVEPLSIAYHAATRTEIRKGDAVVIVGVGTIGLLTLQVVKSMGASTIIAVDIDDEKLARAMKNGATHCVNSTEPDALHQILSITGEGADVAIDATGIAVTANLCINAVHLNGRVVFVGNLAQKIDFPLQAVVTRQISLFGSCASAGEYGKCLELISDGQVDVEAMIDRSVPLSEGGEYILKLYHRQDGLSKVVLLP